MHLEGGVRGKNHTRRTNRKKGRKFPTKVVEEIRNFHDVKLDLLCKITGVPIFAHYLLPSFTEKDAQGKRQERE
jgi:hypothetical protein